MCGLPLWRMADELLAPHVPLPRRPEHYELPDGTLLSAGPQLYRLPERLFDDSGQAPRQALHHVVLDSIHASDVDIRKELIGNVLLTGGTAQLPYLPERLHREMTALLPTAFKVPGLPFARGGRWGRKGRVSFTSAGRPGPLP